MVNKIDIIEFKLLLRALENSAVLIRFRFIGERWSEFSKVLLVSENAAIFEENGKQNVIMNLRNVIEFEIDQPHSDYGPDNSYKITQG